MSRQDFPLSTVDLLHRIQILKDARDRMIDENKTEILLKPKKPSNVETNVFVAVAAVGFGLLIHELGHSRPDMLALFQDVALLVTGAGGAAITSYGPIFGNPRKTPKDNARDLDLIIYDMTRDREDIVDIHYRFDETPDLWEDISESKHRRIPRIDGLYLKF